MLIHCQIQSNMLSCSSLGFRNMTILPKNTGESYLKQTTTTCSVVIALLTLLNDESYMRISECC